MPFVRRWGGGGKRVAGNDHGERLSLDGEGFKIALLLVLSIPVAARCRDVVVDL